MAKQRSTREFTTVVVDRDTRGQIVLQMVRTVINVENLDILAKSANLRQGKTTRRRSNVHTRKNLRTRQMMSQHLAL